VFIIGVGLLAFVLLAQGQENGSAARKFYEFGNTHADNEMAYLDLFALELSQNPKLRGAIVGYSEQQVLRGQFLRRIHGYWNYLVNKRGVEAHRLEVVEGGNRENIMTELWLVPDGARLPGPTPERRTNRRLPLKFDEVSIGVGCEPEFTLNLYELDDGLKFYAEALRENPRTEGRIIVYSRRRNPAGRAAAVARHTGNLLVREYKIEPHRIAVKVDKRRRACMNVELWLAPIAALR
jgi:hypothetical protein